MEGYGGFRCLLVRANVHVVVSNHKSMFSLARWLLIASLLASTAETAKLIDGDSLQTDLIPDRYGGSDVSGVQLDRRAGVSVEEEDSLNDEISIEQEHQLLGYDNGSNDKGHCYHNAKFHKTGESWTVQGECSECSCENGLVSCKPVSCNVPAECRLARAQPLSCCPVCDGCVSASGKAYNMSETWTEDSCTNCTCRGGRIQCHTSACKRLSCEHPKYFPGECCPRCERDDPMTPDQASVDKESCQFLKCHSGIKCTSGFRLDKSGCPTCECQKCQSLFGCKLSCPGGFDLNEFGCSICKCRAKENPFSLFENNLLDDLQKQQLNLSLQLPSERMEKGFTPNGQHPYYNESDGGHHNHSQFAIPSYNYSSSKEHSLPVSIQVLATPIPCTVDSDGVTRMEGQEWTDHCRRCVCRNGREMCSLITCPVPNCEHPVFHTGDCCPQCPDEHSSSSFHPVNVSICLLSDGVVRVEGETWIQSSCLTCTCHKSEVLCAAPDCPAAPCNSPKLVDCCLQCVGSDTETKSQNSSSHKNRIKPYKSNKEKCLSDDSTRRYTHGEMWKVGACQSCRCDSGQIKCFSAGRCPPVECIHPVLPKNHCCPICLENVLHNNTANHQDVKGTFDREDMHSNNNVGSTLLNQSSDTTPSTKNRDPGNGLERHCTLIIVCLLILSVLLSLYIFRQLCFHHRRASRRLIKKVPIGFSSSSSSSQTSSMTRDCCYKCDYSKCCGDTDGQVVVATG